MRPFPALKDENHESQSSPISELLFFDPPCLSGGDIGLCS